VQQKQRLSHQPKFVSPQKKQSSEHACLFADILYSVITIVLVVNLENGTSKT